jgi:hypothetical protein
MAKYFKHHDESQMLPAKYHEGQILEAVVLILKALEPSTWCPETKYDTEPSDRYDVYILRKSYMKADTDLITDYEMSSNLGCGHGPKNDVIVAKIHATEMIKENVDRFADENKKEKKPARRKKSS